MKVGYLADFVMLDSSLKVMKTIKKGEVVFSHD